jgi:arylsulfatase A-like enzyme
MGEHKVYFAHDDYLYQEFIRVPLIIKHAEMRGAYAPRVQLADVLPTLAAIAGIEELKTWRGQDLFSPTYRSVDVYMEIAKAAALVRGNLYLIFDKGKQVYQLFDLSSDPGEFTNTYKAGFVAPHVLDMERVLNENMTLKGFVPERMADESAEEALEKLRSLGYSQ